MINGLIVLVAKRACLLVREAPSGETVGSPSSFPHGKPNKELALLRRSLSPNDVSIWHDLTPNKIGSISRADGV